ncbi:NADH-quinone oxidoreductase subunit C [Kosmotoga olearia]|uniref:NADH dehydrogenase (Ubiquinone) 30 kDa subunit n=1 Tax=Kosmotoga olearia (strain ATCC BAA-1733 / DSM 21960 / TBF 19.5.1) TaxID=521045 RepID=C5CHQ5_KOSOT|nr:NADH-quinone oxidoreductase subunit C [Kosmotoga olearia]ACR80731.1 NADH dehydrogenase (ubiquinone) 30 kDa subunit [Kosmotoga olearia TBF 19.5.1]
MNSMNELIKEVENLFGTIKLNQIAERKYTVDTDLKDLISILELFKLKGWNHLSLISCVDWIDDNQFELIYTLFNWENGITLMVSTKISRETPVAPTVMGLWPTARFYERDIHEFFGVKFDGNDDMKPLILENWKDIPPMRKDFDPHKFSKENFPDRTYDVDFIPEGSEKDG